MKGRAAMKNTKYFTLEVIDNSQVQITSTDGYRNQIRVCLTDRAFPSSRHFAVAEPWHGVDWKMAYSWIGQFVERSVRRNVTDMIETHDQFRWMHKRNDWVKLLAENVEIDEATQEAFGIPFEELDTNFRTWYEEQAEN